MKPRLLLLVLLAASAAASAATQVYSWTDANGVKHFSDSPPPAHVIATKIKVRGQLTTDTSEDAAKGTSGASAATDAAVPKNSGPSLAAAAGYAPDDNGRVEISGLDTRPLYKPYSIDQLSRRIRAAIDG